MQLCQHKAAKSQQVPFKRRMRLYLDKSKLHPYTEQALRIEWVSKLKIKTTLQKMHQFNTVQISIKKKTKFTANDYILDMILGG